jgi:peroxin-5
MHLNTWLQHHPQHSSAAAAAGAPPDTSQALSHSIRTFEAALATTPADADLHMALGVLHHLGRNYSQAIRAFQKALELRPQVRHTGEG